MSTRAIMASAIDKVMTGEIEVKDLVVSKVLRQEIYKYRSLSPHALAALQLAEAEKPLVRGYTIQCIYTDAAHTKSNLELEEELSGLFFAFN